MEVTTEELDQATLLRAVEWGYLPLFATQVIVPPSFLFVTWWYVPVALVVATWLWHPMKYALASYRVATFFCVVNSPLLRWPVGLGFGIFYLIHREYLNAGLAAFWPLAVLVLMQLCPLTKNGNLQQVFAEQILGQDT